MSNEERTGERNFLPLSSAARKVFGVRHVDIDLIQYCPSCKLPELFIEATSTTGAKYTQPLRIVASRCNAPTLLVRHDWGDVAHQHPIDMFLWDAGRDGRNDEPDYVIRNGSWEGLQRFLRHVHENKHECNP